MASTSQIAARHLVAGDLAAHVRLDRGQVGGARPSRSCTSAATRWPSRSSGTPMTSASNTSGVGLQRALDLLGEDLLAAGVHAGVAAAEQRHRAVGLDPGEVAGHRVPLAVHLGEHRRGLDRVLVVAERHVPAPGEPADLARAGRAAVVVEHDGVRARRHGRPAAVRGARR